eukprot:15199130-Alexandrium_andersonii.AAC.1
MELGSRYNKMCDAVKERMSALESGVDFTPWALENTPAGEASGKGAAVPGYACARARASNCGGTFAPEIALSKPDCVHTDCVS